MGLYSDISNSQNSAEGTALHNSGAAQHRFGGLFGVNLAMGVANGSIFNNPLFSLKNKHTVTDDTDIIDVQKQTSNRAAFNKEMAAFNNNPTKEAALALKEKYEKCDDSLIKEFYGHKKEMIEKYINLSTENLT